MAACDELYILMKGQGGHAALPNSVVNPITASAELIINIKQEVSKLNYNEKYILEFGDFHAYGASNVIPEEAKVAGTLRTLNMSFRNRAHGIILEEVKKIEHKYSSNCDIEIKKGYPVLYNDSDLTKSCEQWSQQFIDAKHIKKLSIRMASEDFAYFSQQVPSCFFRIGVGNKQKKIVHSVHTPYFNIDEKSLEIGVGLMSYLTVANLLDLKTT
jgi:amidohydrolase